MGYQYTYLLMDLLFLAFWLFLFLRRKDTRKEILTISLIFGVAGPLAETVYTQDWWSPLTITGTKVGIEDFLFPFMVGGIAAVIFEFVFKKRARDKKAGKNQQRKRNLNLLLLLLILAVLFFGSFYLLKLNSLYSSIIAFVLPIGIIYFKRPDLIVNSIISGILLLVVVVAVYSLLEYLTPGWVREFWYFKNIPEVILFNLPLDDLIWYFLFGLFIGPLYEYWQEAKLVKFKK